jgi:ubiquinol-cytochrome c reductase cytochrome b subunit
VTWIRGDFLISDATLNRFFALHVVALPLVLVMLVFVHIIALHEVGSNNPDGVEIKKKKGADGKPLDGIPFHPYYTVKDIAGVGVFLILFFAVVFFAPEAGGYFLKAANFQMSDPLVTPDFIPPVWYYGAFYTTLRVVPDPFLGVLTMFGAVFVLLFLPWIDRNTVKSIRYRSVVHKFNIIFFALNFMLMTWLGTQPTDTTLVEWGLRATAIYFMFFAVLWFHSRERSVVASVIAFVVLVGIYTFYDLTRVDSETAMLIWGVWLYPTAYLAINLLVPAFVPSVGRDKAVPERVTA